MIGKSTVSLDELMMAVREPELLDTLLDKDPRSVTPERAAEARIATTMPFGRNVSRRRELQPRSPAGSTAVSATDRRACLTISRTCRWPFFMLRPLRSTAEYGRSRWTMVEAEQLNDAELGLEARPIAADSAYWAAMDESRVGYADHLFTAAEDVLGAAVVIDNDRSPEDFKFVRLVSLIEATASELMARGWFDDADQAKADTLLRRLADVADRLVPVDFTFPTRLSERRRSPLY
jgi:hypothetical protein